MYLPHVSISRILWTRKTQNEIWICDKHKEKDKVRIIVYQLLQTTLASKKRRWSKAE